MGKSNNSVRIAITHLSQEHILSHEDKLIREANHIKNKLIDNLSYIFEFDCSITDYLSPKKISYVIHFKKLKIKQKRNTQLYLEFYDTVKSIFKDSDFKIVQYGHILNIIQIVFEHIPSKNNLYPKMLRNSFMKKFYFFHFSELKKRFLFNSNKLKEIVSEKGLFYIYRIELIRRTYNFIDLGICKESKHLLIKYIKMLNLASNEIRLPYVMSKTLNSNLIYLELGTSNRDFHLKHLYNQIKREEDFTAYLFLRGDKTELIEGDLWVPRKKELEDMLFGNKKPWGVDIPNYVNYHRWHTEHKLSIKCEEINLLAYYMEINHDLIWDKNKWKPKPIPPERVFNVNEYLTLILEEKKTNIYVNGKLFNHCKFLLFSLTHNELSEYEEIDSIDEIQDKYDKSHERKHNKNKISSEVEFWGHCSNLQAWYEHNYDTRILHSNLAFPLLKELSKCGDPLAKKVFKEEIALRFESNFVPVIAFLLSEYYLEYLNFNEIEVLSKNLDFTKWPEECFYSFCEHWISKASSNPSEKEIQIRRIHSIKFKREGCHQFIPIKTN